MNVEVYTRCECLVMRSPCFKGLLFGERTKYLELIAIEALRDTRLPETLLAAWQANHVSLVKSDLARKHTFPKRLMIVLVIFALEAIFTIIMMLR